MDTDRTDGDTANNDTANNDTANYPNTGGTEHAGRAAGSAAALGVCGEVEQVMERVAALLESRTNSAGPARLTLDELARAISAVGLGAWRERALLAGGTAELLICDPGVGPGGVAVVVADHGASDALRGRLRRLATHREIAALLVVTTRPRHRTLVDEVTRVPVRVVVISRHQHLRPGSHRPDEPPGSDGPDTHRPAGGPVRTSRGPQRTS